VIGRGLKHTQSVAKACHGAELQSHQSRLRVVEYQSHDGDKPWEHPVIFGGCQVFRGDVWAWNGGLTVMQLSFNLVLFGEILINQANCTWDGE
jgi:hypothetical protein